MHAKCSTSRHCAALESQNVVSWPPHTFKFPSFQGPPMLIAWLEMFRSSHFGMHFAKCFPDRLAFFFFLLFFSLSFLPAWKHFRGTRQSEASWHLNSGALLASRTNTVLSSSMLQSCPRLFDCSIRTTTTGAELARATYISLTRERGSGLRGEACF